MSVTLVERVRFLVLPVIELNFPNPIETRTDLFDRDTELQLIQQTLDSPIRRPIVIMGERVTGKTSLLNVSVESIAKEQRVNVLPLPHVESRANLAEEVLEGIAGEVGTTLYREGLRSPTGELLLSTNAEFVRTASELSARRSDSSFLLCLEELDSMLVKCTDATSDQILGLILHLVNNTEIPVKFLFTMTRTAEHILRSHATSFVNSARIIRVEPWGFEEACEFVTWLFKGAVTFPREAQELIFASCGGHPYLTKAVLRALQELLERSGTAPAITPQLLHTAITAAVVSPELDFTLENIVKVHFSSEELQLLMEVASTGATDLRSLRSPYPEMAYELQRRRFVRIDGNGRCTPTFGLLGEWLKRKPRTLPRLSVSVPSAADPPADASQDVPTLVIDDIRNRVFIDSTEIFLTPQEIIFLRYVAEHAGSVVDRQTVTAEVWPNDVLMEGARETRLDALVSRLRRALDDDGTKYLETRRGRGFYLNPRTVRIHRKA